MLELLLILVFAIHLTAVNVAMTGPLACIWLERRETRNDDAAAGELGRRLAWASVTTLLIGAVLGLLAMGIFWLQRADWYLASMAQVPAQRWWYLVAELVFSLVCLLLYAGLWDRLQRRRGWHRLLAVLSVTNLMYHFPPLFTIISVVSGRPELAGVELERSLFRQLMLEAPVLSRVFHHWLSSLAITGAAVMALSLRMSQQDLEPERLRRFAVGGARLALAASLLQLPVGMWVLVVLPEPGRNALLGENLLATGLLVISLLMVMWLLHQLTAVSLGDVSPRMIVGSIVTLLLVVLLMCGTLHLSRWQKVRAARTAVSADSIR